MRLFPALILMLLLAGCSKDASNLPEGQGVEIYVLTSYNWDTIKIGTAKVLNIKDPVLSEAPMISDRNIKSYTTGNSTFVLNKNVNSLLLTFGADKAFAVTVNKQPIYCGLFRQSYYNSIPWGIAMIYPTFTDDGTVVVSFSDLSNNPLISVDKRNDNAILAQFQASGRLK